MLDLKKRLEEKEKYLDQLKVEINATAGQIILLKDLIKEEESKNA
jgi:hypothetical protein